MRASPDIQVRFCMQSNSVFFNLPRYVSETSHYSREDELLDALSANIADTLLVVEVGGPRSPAG